MAYSFKHRGKTFTAETLPALSDTFAKIRDDSSEGQSTWRDGKLFAGPVRIGYISYNGKIWATDETLLFNPYKTTQTGE